MIRCWIDGRADAHPDPADRALHYGDALFETLAVVQGRPLELTRHLARLERGLARLALPEPSWEAVREEIHRAAAGQERAVLKLLLSRGSGGRGYAPPSNPRPRRHLFLYPWPQGVEAGRREGVEVRWCHTRLARQPALAGIKHANRLEQVLARNEWDDPGIHEGLMLDTAGEVVEGTRSNLFLVRAGSLYTPHLRYCGVAGVMREAVMETAAHLGIPIEEAVVYPEDVETADELFLTNSVIGIWPVRCLQGRRYPAPGAITRRLQEHLPCP